MRVGAALASSVIAVVIVVAVVVVAVIVADLALVQISHGNLKGDAVLIVVSVRYRIVDVDNFHLGRCSGDYKRTCIELQLGRQTGYCVSEGGPASSSRRKLKGKRFVLHA